MRSLSIFTTIDRAGARGYLAATALALVLWFVGITLVTVLIEPTASVVVVGPRSMSIDAAAASDADLLEIYPGFARMRSTRAGFVRRLYAAGAWLVWPAIDGGCVSPAPS